MAYKKELSDYFDSYDETSINLENNQKKDVRIENEKYNFHFRAVAVITQNNKYLIQQIEGYDYYVLPGGHVELGEDSKQAVAREVKEEVGCDIKEAKLFCFHENFYPKKGRTEHWLETYFEIIPKEELPNEDWDTVENDKGEEKLLHFKWVTKEELQTLDLRPTTIKELLVKNQTGELSYLIDKA